MVEPASRDERASVLRRVKVGFVLLIGASTGLMTLVGDASFPVFLGAVAGGLVLGVVLVRFAFPEGGWGRRPE